jgi:hypothetical protein
MKKHQRKVSRGIGSGHGHYNFFVEYPSGKVVTLKNIPDAPLYDAIGDLESHIISTDHWIWRALSFRIQRQKESF